LILKEDFAVNKESLGPNIELFKGAVNGMSNLLDEYLLMITLTPNPKVDINILTSSSSILVY